MIQMAGASGKMINRHEDERALPSLQELLARRGIRPDNKFEEWLIPFAQVLTTFSVPR
jgi:hypothetical protein